MKKLLLEFHMNTGVDPHKVKSGISDLEFEINPVAEYITFLEEKIENGKKKNQEP